MTLAVVLSLPVVLAVTSLRWGADSRRSDVRWFPDRRADRPPSA